ncbi:MAG: hypothetical protein ACK4NC_05905 [Candidatus Gracilibacteria bacterium]
MQTTILVLGLLALHTLSFYMGQVGFPLLICLIAGIPYTVTLVFMMEVAVKTMLYQMLNKRYGLSPAVWKRFKRSVFVSAGCAAVCGMLISYAAYTAGTYADPEMHLDKIWHLRFSFTTQAAMVTLYLFQYIRTERQTQYYKNMN